MLAWLPEWGWTLACSAPKSFLARSMASCSTDIHVFAAAVPALAGVAFGVFVGQHRALGLHDGGADEVFAGDQLDVFLLALPFAGQWRRRFPGQRPAAAESMGMIRVSILLTRRSWRPPSKRACRKASTIFLACFGRRGAGRPGRGHWRCCAGGPGAAVCSSTTSAARTPGTLLAAMLMPMPVVQISTPNSARARRDALGHRLGVIRVIAGFGGMRAQIRQR